MTESKYFPTFDENDSKLFRIEDARDRADALRSAVVPKLRTILGVACDEVLEIYGPDALEGSHEATSPAHRRKAKRTMLFNAASAGLRHDIAGHHYFMLSFRLVEDALLVELEANRPAEARPLARALQKYEDEIANLLDRCDGSLWWPGRPEDLSDIRVMIRTMKIPDKVQWADTRVLSGFWGLPVAEDEQIWNLIDDFLGFVPIYKAVGEILTGVEDRFEDYYRQYNEWSRSDAGKDGMQGVSEVAPAVGVAAPALALQDQPDEIADGLSAIEGEVKEALRRHRHREKSLRKSKIRDALRRGNGRLRCEVPGCGFDFAEVYGEIGEAFAHVHHLKPLGDLSAPSETRLEDLTIVCANCHAMIHRGGVTRPLEGLINRRRR